ncbi:hypothetical protein QTP88_003671 [Uroleucon formosanum]
MIFNELIDILNRLQALIYLKPCGLISDEIMGTTKGPASAEAFAAFETGLEWFEKQAECCPTQLLLLKRLRDLTAEKSVAAHHQIKIDSFIKKI